MIKSKNYILEYNNKIYEYNKEDIPEYFDIILENKEYIFYQKIANKKFNLFTTIPSIPISKVIHLSVIRWLNNNIKNDIFKTYSNNLNQPGIAINNDLCNNIKKSTYARSLDTTNCILPVTNKYKIHINIKLKYLFFVIKKIIKNFNKFIVNGKPLFSFLKFHTDFYIFTEKLYYPPNIVFYQYEDKDPEVTKLCFQKLVQVLLKLFPDTLNISSKIYSKFSFKLNNNIYLVIGDGYDKINKSNEYTIPVEYKEIIQSCSKDKIKLVKKLSNHDLCKNVIDDNINYLVKKDNNSINNIFIDIGLDPIF
jgi:hypothetical protein